MFHVEEESSGGYGSEIDEEIAGDDSTTSLSRWVFDEKDDYEVNEDYDDDGYDEHNHADMDSDDEDDNVEQRLIRTSPAVDSFDVDALEIPGTQKNEIEVTIFSFGFFMLFTFRSN